MARPTNPLTLADAQALAASFLEARRAKHGTARMDATDGGGGGTGGAGTGGDNAGTGGDNAGAKTFDQAAVDRLIGEAKRQAVAKFADYDDLKAKAEAGKTTEQKLAELERGIAEERLSRIRLEVATSTEGLGKEWADDLKGATKEELEAHAKSLAERLGKAGGAGTGRARTARRTVTETATAPADKKAAAVQALRELRGKD